MNTTQRFNQLQQQLSATALREFCKKVQLEKENYSKLFVQKTQQYLSEKVC